MDHENLTKTPKTFPCPRCGKPMLLSRVTPGIGALSELWTFACRDCTEAATFTRADALADASKDALQAAA